MLKGAIIGAGKIAQSCHIPAYFQDEIKGRVLISSAMDPDQRSLEMIRGLCNGIKTYNNLEELLEKEKPDFCDICTPPKYHGEAIRACILRNIPIICEKPLCSSYKESVDLYDYILRSRIQFAPCHQYKFSPVWEAFKAEASRNRESGRKMMLKFEIYRSGADEGLAVLKNRWRTDPSFSGGGIIADTGVHYLYLTAWMMGLPNKICAQVFNLGHPDYQTEDSAILSLYSDSGYSDISLSWSSDRRVNSARMFNGTGSLYYDGGRLLRYLDGKEEVLFEEDLSDKKSYVTWYRKLFTGFLDQVESGLYDKAPLEEAFATSKILHLCYSSAEERKTLKATM